MSKNQFGIVDCSSDLEFGKGIAELAKESRGFAEGVRTQSEMDKEQQRVKHNRDYFEAGCLCMRSGKLSKQPETVSDAEAVKFYEENCKCSRNYIKS